MYGITSAATWQHRPRGRVLPSQSQASHTSGPLPLHCRHIARRTGLARGSGPAIDTVYVTATVRLLLATLGVLPLQAHAMDVALVF